MKCLQDIKYDIVDKIGKDLTQGGLFYYGSNRNTLVFAGTESILTSVAQAYNDMFREELITYQSSNGKFLVFIVPSDSLAENYLGQYGNSNSSLVFEGQPVLDEITSQAQAIRSQFIDNTGPNTERFADLAPIVEEKEEGVFAKYITHKRTLVKLLQNRLSQINKELKDSKLSVERRTELNNLRQTIKVRIEGDIHRNLKGLTQEINELEKEKDINAVGYYVEQDLQRLSVIAYSNNANDLKEARTIIDFYDRAGTFNSEIDNPFFSQREMFFEDENTGGLLPDYRLADSTMEQYKKWRDLAMSFVPAVDMKEKDITVTTFNSDKGVQLTGEGKQFNFDEIVHTQKGLKDVDWISAWAMDVTQAIFSEASALAQVMHTYLVNAMEKNYTWSRDFAHRMEEITPAITKRLGEIGDGKYKLKAFGIIGVNGVSYDLFLDKTANGQQTGTLVQRFTKEFLDAQAEEEYKFSQSFERARNAEEGKASLFNRAFEELKRWKRANTFMINPSLIQEILDDPALSEFNTGATPEQIAEHKRELVEILGERGYNEQVEVQREMLYKYIADFQSYINSQMIFEGVENFDDLTEQSKFAIKHWQHQHSPMTGVEDYHTATGVYADGMKINSFMDYNNTVPRAIKVNIGTSKDQVTFTNTNESTAYYNNDFKTIERDDTLREFYELVKEGIDKIRDVTPYDLQTKMAANTLPMLLKNTAEFLLDNNNSTLSMISMAWRRLMERIGLSFGVIKESEVSTAIKDPITGKYNYKVNDQFLTGNSRSIRERMTIESIKFAQAHGGISKVRRFTTVPLSSMNVPALAHVSSMLNIDITLAEISAGKINKIRALTGDNVEIGKIIRDFATHSAVQAQSFDLPKLMKHFTNLAMAYAARTEALPVMEIMKKHYEGIRNPKTNNTGKSIFNVLENKIASEGGRDNAVRQMEDWFQRVMLDNYGLKHVAVHGNPIITKRDEENGEVSTKIPFFSKIIYSNDEKQKIREIDKLLSIEQDPDKIKELNKIKANFGKVRTASAAVLNFLSAVRTLGLGWNLSSALTNFAEGYTSNMILASTGEYFNPEEIYYGYAVGKHSWLKNTTFGLATTGLANKNRMLMDRYNVLLDSKNELQKSTTKTNLSRLEALNPHEINARVEYINQSPIMVAMLRTQKIIDKNGNEESVWNAMDNDGNLLEDFRTEENINNWEKLTGEQYLAFKNKLNEAIVRAHGNYDEMRGMMAKSNLAGKALLMFKTWLPAQLYWRFAAEQKNLKTGATVKGRYRSFTPGSAAVFGAGVGFVAFGPIGTAIGALGYLGGKYFGIQTELGALREMLDMTKSLFLKALGMPVNIIAGRNLINSKDDFNKWVGTGEFTELDAKNMRGNISEMAILMTTLALMLMVKGFFWDDDDEKDSAERQFHNYAVNKLMQLATQATMYVNPSDLYKNTFGSMAVLKHLDQWRDEIDKLAGLAAGHDPGGKKFLRQSAKFMPGMFKDGLPFQDGKPGLGFNTQAERQFTPSPFDDWFKSEEVLAAKRAKEERKIRSEELKQMGYTDKNQRTKILNIEMPTPRQLEKKGLTAEEWKEINSDYELPEPEVKEKEEEE